MRFSTKIFIAIVGVTMLGVLLTSLSVYEVSKHLYQTQYARLYQERLELVARNFVSLEDETLKVSLNAAKYISEIEAQRKLSSLDLKKLASELAVDEISIIDTDGTFLKSSTEIAHENLYSANSAYRGLVQGSIDHFQTPLMPDKYDPKTVAWFTLIPSKNHKHIIDIRDTFENISKTLEQLTEDNSDIVQVTLLSPSGTVLGDVENHELSYLVKTNLEVSIPATVSLSGPYQYKFVAGLTNHSLEEALSSLKEKFLIIVSILMVIAFTLSLWLTKILLRKITKIQNTVDAIAESGDFSKKILLPNKTRASKDELDLLSNRFNKMFDNLHENQEKLIEAQRAEAKAHIAAQVAHDIRSPLTSMNLALNQLQPLVPTAGDEMFSLLSHAISRISGIVKRLSTKEGNVESNTIEIEVPKLTLLDKIFFDVAQEHALKIPRTQKFRISGFNAVPNVWSVIQVTEIQTALSNILNNASEAVGDNGVVDLSAQIEGKELIIKISDNGKGIAPENLNKVFERGITLGKSSGSGLGLYQAKKALEWSGGKISITSELAVGTEVKMSLPIEKVPGFTTLEVHITSAQKLIVTDDDPKIIEYWKKNFSRILTYSSFSQLEAALPNLGELSQYVFVLDQFAGDGREGLTGTAFIEKYKMQAFLSTSEFDDPAIQEKVKTLKAKLIPKPQLAGVVIRSDK